MSIRLSGKHFSESHDDVIKWKHFPCNWPFVRGIHLSPVNSPHKGQWRGALMFTLIWVSINGCVNTREAGDLRRYRLHYDVIVMLTKLWWLPKIFLEMWSAICRPFFSGFHVWIACCLSLIAYNQPFNHYSSHSRHHKLALIFCGQATFYEFWTETSR